MRLESLPPKNHRSGLPQFRDAGSGGRADYAPPHYCTPPRFSDPPTPLQMDQEQAMTQQIKHQGFETFYKSRFPYICPSQMLSFL